MKAWLKSLFSEDSSVSCVRVMAMMALLFGGYLAVIGKDACVGIFVTAAFSAKVAQRLVESREKTPTTETSTQTEVRGGL